MFPDEPARQFAEQDSWRGVRFGTPLGEVERILRRRDPWIRVGPLQEVGDQRFIAVERDGVDGWSAICELDFYRSVADRIGVSHPRSGGLDGIHGVLAQRIDSYGPPKAVRVWPADRRSDVVVTLEWEAPTMTAHVDLSYRNGSWTLLERYEERRTAAQRLLACYEAGQVPGELDTHAGPPIDWSQALRGPRQAGSEGLTRVLPYLHYVLQIRAPLVDRFGVIAAAAPADRTPAQPMHISSADGAFVVVARGPGQRERTRDLVASIFRDVHDLAQVHGWDLTSYTSSDELVWWVEGALASTELARLAGVRFQEFPTRRVRVTVLEPVAALSPAEVDEEFLDLSPSEEGANRTDPSRADSCRIRMTHTATGLSIVLDGVASAEEARARGRRFLGARVARHWVESVRVSPPARCSSGTTPEETARRAIFVVSGILHQSISSALAREPELVGRMLALGGCIVLFECDRGAAEQDVDARIQHDLVAADAVAGPDVHWPIFVAVMGLSALVENGRVGRGGANPRRFEVRPPRGVFGGILAVGEGGVAEIDPEGQLDGRGALERLRALVAARHHEVAE